MNDLIDRQKAIDAILNDRVEITPAIKAIGNEYGFEVHNTTCDRHTKMLRELPTAITKDDILEQKDDTAEWLMGGVSYICDTSVYCSKCKWAWGKKEELGFFDFCPSCGRKIIHRGKWRRVGGNN